MPSYPIYNLKNAPETSRPALETLQSAFGFIPNMAGAMATSPVLIAGLVDLFRHVHGGNFNEPQLQVLLLTNAVTNSAEWAVAFHSALAISQGIAEGDVKAIRARREPADPKLAALFRIASTLIEARGKPDECAVHAFLEAGFSPEDLLEVIAVSAASTITNYTANVTKPPLDAGIEGHAWRADETPQSAEK